jgi:hypothetical protein
MFLKLKSIVMRPLLFTLVLISTIFIISCNSNSGKNEQKDAGLSVEFVKHASGGQIDVMIDGQLFTSYKWPEGVYKPVLDPILTSSGTIITRGFPLDPRPGERPDHRHHVGNWLNYGNVNGFDFWGNGHTGERSPNGGEIKLMDVEQLLDGIGDGAMTTTASWVDPEGNELLAEKTEYHFIADSTIRIIDRITKLTAGDQPVSMSDTKEGMFAIRVARQLELPSDGDITVLDAEGNPSTVSAMSNEGITGNYLSSEGRTGSGVWGTRAKWMDLYGSIGDEKISLVICDHPKNPGYPTYWHARGYGLFAANPLGVKDFTDGAKEMNFSIPSGQSVTFRYRLIISSNAHLTGAEINKLSADFTKKY